MTARPRAMTSASLALITSGVGIQDRAIVAGDVAELHGLLVLDAAREASGSSISMAPDAGRVCADGCKHCRLAHAARTQCARTQGAGACRRLRLAQRLSIAVGACRRTRRRSAARCRRSIGVAADGVERCGLRQHAFARDDAEVGLKPMQPQYEAGRRIEPAVCVPSASGTCASATAAAEPDDEPPGVRSRIVRIARLARAEERQFRRTVLPKMTAPAARSAVTTRIRCGRRPAKTGVPFSVGKSDGIDDVLDADRYAVQCAERLAAGDGGVGGVGLLERV